jgi:hypothetical protein
MVTMEHVSTRIKLAAYAIYNAALKAGTLVRPDRCVECPRTVGIQGHHEDYSKPLDVAWLCRKCHAKRHPRKKLRFTLLR